MPKDINGIPVNCNTEKDKEIFGKVFTEGFSEPTLGDETSNILPIIDLGLNYKSPFGEKSVFANQYWENLQQERLERELNELSKTLNSSTEILDDFEAGENSEGNPEKNGFAHGDIEHIALSRFFSIDEISEIYFGNWLRDVSQFLVAITVRPDERTIQQIYARYGVNSQQREVLEHFFNFFTHENWVAFIELWATKEFIWNQYFKKNKSKMPYTNGELYIKELRNKYPEINKNTLGIYRPEEHIDNPKGLKDDSKYDYINFYYEYPKFKQRKIQLYSGETPVSLFVNSKSNLLPAEKEHYHFSPEGLKYYIFKDVNPERPSSVTYFRQQLELAMTYGETKEGRMHLGAALHVLEDYFAHTNFVEICLIKLIDEAIYPWVEFVDETSCKVDEVNDDKYWSDKNKWVIQSSVNGVINKRANAIPVVTGIFLTDDTIASISSKIYENLQDFSFEPYKSRLPGERSLFDISIITFLEAYIKKQKIELQKKQKFDATFWLNSYNKYLAAMDFIADKIVNNKVLEVAARVLNFLPAFFSYICKIILQALGYFFTKGIYKGIKEVQNAKKYGSNPTHTQIAKDVLKHPLNTLAGKLAVAAVTEVGAYTKGSMKSKTIGQEAIKFFIEKYFSHPCKTNWMDQIVIDWAKGKEDILKQLHSHSIYEDTMKFYQETDVNKENFIDKMNSTIEKIKRIKFFWIILLVPFIAKTQVKNEDTTCKFSVYSSKQCGFQFSYPSDWKRVQFSKKNCDDPFFFQDTLNKSLNDSSIAILLYWQSEFIKLIGSTEEYLNNSKSKITISNNDSFELMKYERKINKNKIVYYDIRAYHSYLSTKNYHYTPVFIRDSIKNLVFDIELSFPQNIPNKYDKMYEYICDNFNFINLPKSRIVKKNKKHSKA